MRKLGDGWVRSRFTYDRTFRIHLMAVNCVAAECDVLIKRKESSLVGIPTLVGTPNKRQYYVEMLVKIKHQISYFYNALLEQHMLHQAWCEA